MTDLLTLAARTVMASFPGESLPDWGRRRLAEGLGGICLFGENVTSRDGAQGSVTVHQDVALYAGLLEKDGTLTYENRADRYAWPD